MDSEIHAAIYARDNDRAALFDRTDAPFQDIPRAETPRPLGREENIARAYPLLSIVRKKVGTVRVSEVTVDGSSC